jgi:hypothetical protein
MQTFIAYGRWNPSWPTGGTKRSYRGRVSATSTQDGHMPPGRTESPRKGSGAQVLETKVRLGRLLAPWAAHNGCQGHLPSGCAASRHNALVRWDPRRLRADDESSHPTDATIHEGCETRHGTLCPLWRDLTSLMHEATIPRSKNKACRTRYPVIPGRPADS